MSDVPHFETFEEFWPYYVREHSKKTTRVLHFTGTSLAFATIAYAAIKRRPRLLLLAPVLGYGLSWIGHFFVEQNRPATFTYPLWSLRGDFRMLAKMIVGTMDDEVERVMREARQGNGRSEHDFEPAAESSAN
jgi:hypothetical protein